MIFYYSGCGNSRWVAKELAAALDEKLSFIPDLQREGFKEYEIGEDESIGFVFPIYSWAAPELVERFVRETRWVGKSPYVWFACTCGDEMGLTYDTFGKILSQAGLGLQAAFCFQMPETYLCMPGFHLDTDEGARRKISAAAEKLPAAARLIKERAAAKDLLVGSMSWLKSYIIKPGFVRYVSDKGYRVEDSCNGCGTCARVCPLHNIKLSDAKRPEWQGHCTQCMACYHHCPQNAIQYGRCTKDKGQYYFGKI